MNLTDIRPPKGATRKRKRLGRGPGSGHGKTAGRGEKGQKSRSGYSRRPGFEGGQMPLVRRVPKRGFNNIFRTEYAIVNVSRLNELEGDEFTPQTLFDRGVVAKMRDGLKILAHGEIGRPIKITAHKISEAARKKIEAAGGSVTLIESKPKPAGKLPKREKKAEAAS